MGAFAVYRGIGFLLIFLALFALNVAGWVAKRINYIFIFEFDPRAQKSALVFLEVKPPPSVCLCLFSSLIFGFRGLFNLVYYDHIDLFLSFSLSLARPISPTAYQQRIAGHRSTVSHLVALPLRLLAGRYLWRACGRRTVLDIPFYVFSCESGAVAESVADFLSRCTVLAFTYVPPFLLSYHDTAQGGVYLSCLGLSLSPECFLFVDPSLSLCLSLCLSVSLV